jgi:Universal stress protein family
MLTMIRLALLWFAADVPQERGRAGSCVHSFWDPSSRFLLASPSELLRMRAGSCASVRQRPRRAAFIWPSPGGQQGFIRGARASDLNPNILVTHGASIYAEILGVAEEAEADLVVVGSHRPAMKDYLLGTNAARVVRHARCSVLVARE